MEQIAALDLDSPLSEDNIKLYIKVINYGYSTLICYGGLVNALHAARESRLYQATTDPTLAPKDVNCQLFANLVSKHGIKYSYGMSLSDILKYSNIRRCITCPSVKLSIAELEALEYNYVVMYIKYNPNLTDAVYWHFKPKYKTRYGPDINNNPENVRSTDYINPKSGAVYRVRNNLLDLDSNYVRMQIRSAVAIWKLGRQFVNYRGDCEFLLKT